MTDGEKLCKLCGVTCAGLPRIKDPHGRYYHETCYEDAKRRIAAHKAAAEPDLDLLETPPTPQPSPVIADDVPIIEVADARAAFVTCPGCSKPLAAPTVVCTECGYNLKTGQQLAVEKKVGSNGGLTAGAGGLAGSILSPLGVGLLAFIGFAALVGLALVNETMTMPLMLAWLVFSSAIGIVVLVFAFMESIVQGLLTMFVPFYVLYFVYGVCGNGYVKILYTISLLLIPAVLFVVYQQTGGFEPMDVMSP